MLSIDRTAVRERALAAFDALGPQTQISDLRRALITDYLLGQLPPPSPRRRATGSRATRASARGRGSLASELAPLSSGPLPEIPAGPRRRVPTPRPAPRTESPSAGRGRPRRPPPHPGHRPRALRRQPRREAPDRRADHRSSRLGGIILLDRRRDRRDRRGPGDRAHLRGLARRGRTAPRPPHRCRAPHDGRDGRARPPAQLRRTPQVVAQINLLPPSGGGEVGRDRRGPQGGRQEGDRDRRPAHDAQLATSRPTPTRCGSTTRPADAKLLGFVNPGVGKNGRLSTAGGLPANAAHFHKLIITLETKANPKTPGTIVLSGALTGL